MEQFNYKKIECNGIGGYGYQAVAKHKDQIKSICQEVRDLLGDQLWKKMRQHADEKEGWGEYHPGSRYTDLDSNASRLVTGIAKHVSSYMQDDNLIEMHVGAVLDNLSIEEKVYMVLDALRDCASADHWYTFEKDWS